MVTAFPRLALSIQQPWAWLIVKGIKPVENRTWWTKIRGPVVIHASKQLAEATLPQLVDYYGLHALVPDPDGVVLHRGGLIGRADLVDCVKSHSSQFFQGTYGFVFDNARELPFYACRGRLNFFEYGQSPELPARLF